MRALREDLRPATRAGECFRRTDACCSRRSSFPLAGSPGYGGTDCRSVGAFACGHGNADPRLLECRGSRGSARSVLPWSSHARGRPRERSARRLLPHRDDRAHSGFGRRSAARAQKETLPCAGRGNPSSPARRAPTVRERSRRRCWGWGRGCGSFAAARSDQKHEQRDRQVQDEPSGGGEPNTSPARQPQQVVLGHRTVTQVRIRASHCSTLLL
jgi:hypothetical protein